MAARHNLLFAGPAFFGLAWNGEYQTAHKQCKNGCSSREFEKGTVIYNPIDNRPVLITFDQPRTSAATGERGYLFIVQPRDGDMFLR